MTLEQITETLTVLPERIALQLQGQSLQLNIMPNIIPSAAPPLPLASAAPMLDSARTLENLFPPLIASKPATAPSGPSRAAPTPRQKTRRRKNEDFVSNFNPTREQVKVKRPTKVEPNLSTFQSSSQPNHHKARKGFTRWIKDSLVKGPNGITDCK